MGLRYQLSYVVRCCVILIAGLFCGNAEGSFYFEFDYSYDSEGYFDVPERRLALETAGRLLERYTDDLAAIEPTEANTWTAFFAKPDGSGQIFFPSIDVPENVVRVYAAGRPLPGRLAQAIEMGAVGAGDSDWIDLVDSRGQSGVLDAEPSDFATLGGSISFNSDFEEFDWHFGLETTELNANEFDFLTIAMHELLHLMGFGVAPSFAAQVNGNGQFIGEAAIAVGSPTNENLQLDSVEAHWESGTHGIWAGVSQEALLAPGIYPGRRTFPSDLDLAAMADVGWTPAIAGDANRDDVFNSADLLEVFQPGKYETGQLAVWAEGDWNNDGVFDSGDITVALQTGTYSVAASPRANHHSVPEPTSLQWPLLLGLIGTRHWIRHRRSAAAN